MPWSPGEIDTSIDRAIPGTFAEVTGTDEVRWNDQWMEFMEPEAGGEGDLQAEQVPQVSDEGSNK
ncbi:hypothetical protein ACEPPN_000353 [Leptodophora sp. 'Broadleaf-Isolate-01']